MRRPFPARRISSPYGWRRDLRGARSFHLGTDYDVPSGSTVQAVNAGTVIRNAWSEQLGWTLEVAHDEGWRTKYMHLREQSPLAVGASVARAQAIGIVGATGTAAFGAHLHLETWHHGRHVDPETYLTLTPSEAKETQ